MQILPEPGQRCGIYARVSTVGQTKEDTFGLATQVAACRVHAERQSWLVAEQHVVEEVASGALHIRERPGLARQLDALDAGQIDVLLIHAPDRLSRNQVVTALVLDRVERTQRVYPRARLACVLHDHESGALGTFRLNAMTFVAEVTRERIKENTMRGLRGKAASGKPLGSARAPFGLRYSEDRGHYEPDPATVHHLHWLFEQADRGSSLRKLATGLEARQARPPYFGRANRRSASGHNDSPRWGAKTVRNILLNTNYIGEGYAFSSTRGTRLGRRESHQDREVVSIERRPADAPEVIRLPDGTYPRLIDPALFGRVGERLRQNKRETQRADRDPHIGIFRRGFGRCGDCGSTLQVVVGGRGDASYSCNRSAGCGKARIAVGKLDGPAWNHVEGLLQRPQVIAERLDHLNATDSTKDDLAGIDAVLTGIGKQETNLAHVVEALDDPDAAAPLLVRLKELAAQRKAAAAERDAIMARHAMLDGDRRRLGEMIDYTEQVAEQVAGEVSAMSWEARRGALRALGVLVMLYPASHRPRWQISLTWQDTHPKVAPMGPATYVEFNDDTGGVTQALIGLQLRPDYAALVAGQPVSYPTA